MKYEDTTSLLDVDIPSPEDEYQSAQATQWSSVFSAENLASWQVQALRELHEMTNLPPNWDSYGSPPPTQEATKTAVLLLMQLDEFTDFPTPRVLPVSGGGIELIWRKGRRELQVDIVPGGQLEFLLSEGEKVLVEGTPTKLPVAEIYSLLFFRSLRAA